MKNKNGFTIMEILAVVVIIATVTAIAVPSIFKITNKARERLYCSKLEIVQKSAERYADDNDLINTCQIDNIEYNCESITIQDLINGNYVDADGLDGAFVDPRNSASLNTKEILIYEKNDRNYAYLADEDCSSLVVNVLTPTELTNIKHSLTVNLDGGTWNGTSPVTLRETETLFVNNPVRAGHEFVRWDVTGNDSDINDKIFTMGKENSTLTAVWHALGYTLTINANGGTWSGTTPQIVAFNNTVTINDPIKSGYAFTGWTINGAGSTVNGTTFTMGTENTTITANWIIVATTDFYYTGAVQTYTVPANGYYRIRLWGPRGNTYNGVANGGFGAYNYGTIYLTAGLNLYFYVGSSTSSFNGGSVGGKLNATEIGGGATDVRLVGGAWNDATGLKSRIMVAASGGGTGESSSAGGSGGGLIGNNGTISYSGYGSTQIAGGAGGANGGMSGSAGGFGYGGNGGLESCCAYGGGGGAGYYGGGGGAGVAGADGAGGGGSSFISGYAGVNAITSSSSTTPTYNTIHYSNKYFFDTSMFIGANPGNGIASISYVSQTPPVRLNTDLNNVRYVKDCINGNSSTDQIPSWVELQAIYQGNNVAKNKTITGTVAQNASYPYSRIVDGDITTSNWSYASVSGLQCVTVDLGQTYNLDEVAVWHYWGDGRTYYDNATYVSSDNSNWTIVINTSTSETSQGKRIVAYAVNYNFDYTGNPQALGVPYTGNYLLEVWGAQGGYGGYGGYSKGVVSLNKYQTLWIYVGSTTFSGTGGWNGGGSVGGSVYGGGGATHIATTSGALSSLSSNQGAILIVAGGGGGYGNGYAGGSGGGIIGTNGSGEDLGRGGSQTGGGGISSSCCGAGYGGFGVGGSGSWYSESLGGGGGGFYGGGSGGGSGNNGGGGGGSGYIANALLTNKYMYCFNCTTSAVASTLTYSTANASYIPYSDVPKAGNGYARITYIG